MSHNRFNIGNITLSYWLVFAIAISIVIAVYVRQDDTLASLVRSLFAQGEEIVMDGYVIRTSETLTFSAISPRDSSQVDSREAWVRNPNSDSTTRWVEKFQWAIVSSDVTYVKVHVEGRLYGPGTYGHLGKYRYEIDIKKIRQL